MARTARWPRRNSAPARRILHDEDFRYATAWRGAGVALPVFALRSEKGLGVGEFLDLKLLIDWAGQTDMKLVQVLPINDTTATHTWVDSYPYAAISVFALHPQYLNLDAIAPLKGKADQQELARLRAELNAKDFVDYEPVMNAKWRFLKKLYLQEKNRLLTDPEFQRFKAEQADWLVPYAAFSALRDRFQTADFSRWPVEFQSPKNLDQLTAETSPDFDEFGLHFFTQFHLDKQLREAVEYGRQKGVVLKGDLPIGIYRHSVDAWTQPELYHMDAQAGAPPDDFSTTGQNWRFPTYNWERMAQDGYQWWKQRLGHLSRYFDALRIDHILGFFRIWEIPEHSVEGLLGHFAPALPLHCDEIKQRLGWFDHGRLAEPYIRWHMLQDLLGQEAQAVSTSTSRKRPTAPSVSAKTFAPSGRLKPISTPKSRPSPSTRPTSSGCAPTSISWSMKCCWCPPPKRTSITRASPSTKPTPSASSTAMRPASASTTISTSTFFFRPPRSLLEKSRASSSCPPCATPPICSSPARTSAWCPPRCPA